MMPVDLQWKFRDYIKSDAFSRVALTINARAIVRCGSPEKIIFGFPLSRPDSASYFLYNPGEGEQGVGCYRIQIIGSL